MALTIGNNLPRIKVANQFAIREVIYKYGPVSRLEISERLNLTLPTITTNVSLMIARGLLKEIEAPATGKTLGRKTMLVDFNPEARLFMGIEMRRHASYATIVDLRGNTIAENSMTVFHDDYEGALDEACRLGVRTLEDAGLTWDDISGMGFALPGIVDTANGMLKIHPRFKWKDLETAKHVRERTGYQGSIHVQNNTCARVYCFSMFQHDVFRGADRIAYMYVGSGIKCPLVFSLNDHFGDMMGEGEVGHMVMNIDGPRCRCGNRGCLESYSSENALEKKMEELIATGRSPLLKELVGDRRLNVAALIEAEEMGDEAAREVVDEAIKYLSLAIANINNFVKPECVVVDCRLFSTERNRKRLEEEVERSLSWNEDLEYGLAFVDTTQFSGARGAAAGAIKENLKVYME